MVSIGIPYREAEAAQDFSRVQRGGVHPLKLGNLLHGFRETVEGDAGIDVVTNVLMRSSPVQLLKKILVAG